MLEYLLGKYCVTEDSIVVQAGLKIVNSTLAENFVRPDEANKIPSLVKQKGKYTLIDKVKVRQTTNVSHKDTRYITLCGSSWAAERLRARPGPRVLVSAFARIGSSSGIFPLEEEDIDAVGVLDVTLREL